MGDTVFNIQTVNIGTGEKVGEILGELGRGDSPEALRDRGDNVPEGAEDAAAPAPEPLPDEEEERIQYLEDENEADEARRLDRRTNLERVLERSEEYGNRRGHLRTSDPEHQPDKRVGVQLRHKRSREQAQRSLELACAVCSLAARCRLRNDFDKWFETKPYKDKSSVPKHFRPQVTTETRTTFRKDLRTQPEPHCDPKKRENTAPIGKAA